MNSRYVIRVLGQIQVLIALAMLTALPWSLFYRDGDHIALLEAFGTTLGIGVVMWMVGRRAPDQFFRREAMAIVGLGWLLSALTAALPFIYSGTLGPVDAVFEAMSGLTTTGATTITDIRGALDSAAEVAKRHHGVMFWRSMTHWLGGMGIVVLLLAFLPAAGGAKAMFQSEVPGLRKEGIKPRIQQTAMRLWLLYLLLSVAECTLLLLAGMGVFDALCHTFGTVATGGFSTRDASIGAYDSLPIELIILVFMAAAGSNFTLHYHLAHGRVLTVLRDPEWLLYVGVLAGASVLIALDMTAWGTYPEAGFPQLLRWSSFTVVSCMTTTGFVTANFDSWPAFSKIFLMCLMFMGGCAGSTGGGLKVVRVLLLFKVAGHQIRRIFSPRRVLTLRIAGQVVDEDLQLATLTFFALFMMVFAGSALVLAGLGVDLLTAVSASIATLNNVGPGLAGIGATQTYAQIPDLGKLVLVFNMVVGRLELWAILCLLLPSFWRQRGA